MQARPMPSCGVRSSVRHVRIDSVETNKHIFKNFSPWQYSDSGSLNGAVECRWVGTNRDSGRVKTAFHYSSQLQTWLQTWFSTRFAAMFSTSSCGFETRFRLFLSKTWSWTAAGSLVRARARQMECRKKTSFKQVRSWLSTCFRPVCDQVFDQIYSSLE